MKQTIARIVLGFLMGSSVVGGGAIAAKMTHANEAARAFSMKNVVAATSSLLEEQKAEATLEATSTTEINKDENTGDDAVIGATSTSVTAIDESDDDDNNKNTEGGVSLEPGLFVHGSDGGDSADSGD